MLKHESIDTSIISLYDHPSFLSPLWRVIYQEAMRGHHLLFAEQKSSPRTRSTLGFTYTKKELENAEDTSVEILQLNQLGLIKKSIDALNEKERLLLFRIYKTQLATWQKRLAQSYQ